ncbi:MAG: hypothetical protein RI907_3445 [Pseudomonadota bacterium]|jgi:hydroxymethylpyrimidine kinase/phosphomethylpyrimidine kinase/thiamine-phosphate diphosphorylase
MDTPRPPIVWSIAGLDTAGGAGLSADQRAADALGVHLCPVAACLTAQSSLGVQSIHPVSVAVLNAQLQALATDLPPRVIKTGLLGDVALVQAVAQWVDRLRAHAPAGVDPHHHLALVVDPVLKASAGGAPFASAEIVAAYREHLLPRATLVTPNRAEAAALLATDAPAPTSLPNLAQGLLASGARAVAITGGDAQAVGLSATVGAQDQAQAIDWLHTPHAQGWLCAPRVATRHTHGTGCTFASAAAAALALGHVEADAVVLAKMVTRQALVQSHAAGQGPGPVRAAAAPGPQPFGAMPWLGMGEALPWQLTWREQGEAEGATLFLPFEPPGDGLYGILADHQALRSAAEAGVACLQLRHKARAGVEAQITAAADACAQHGATFFVNDHWDLALDLLGTEAHRHLQLGLHLGQEDLLALDAQGQARLRQARHRVRLGLSSHSLWELARAAGCGASLIACGPVQATTTKDMPWLPQGEDNLRWWVAHSPVPVVAIGGLLTPADLQRHAACGPATLCVVRGLGQTPDDMARLLPPLREAVRLGRAAAAAAPEPAPRCHAVLPH